MAFDVHFLSGAGALCGAENGLASPNGADVNCEACAALRPPPPPAEASPPADAPHPKIAARYYPRPPPPAGAIRRRWA